MRSQLMPSTPGGGAVPLPGAALWSVRTAGLAVVGLLTFLEPPAARGAAVTQVVAYTLVCAGMAARSLPRFARYVPGTVTGAGLPAALGTVTVAGCLGAAAGGGGESMIAFAAVAVMSAAEELPVQACLTIVVAGVLATETGAVVFGQGAGTQLGFPLLLAVAVLFGRNRASLRVQAEQARQLLAQHDQLRAEQRRADVLEERTRIAREIHDVLAHSLGALGVQLQTIEVLVAGTGDRDRALELLAASRRIASEGLADTRRAVQALRATTLPLPDEVARAAAEFAGRHGVRVGCQTSGPPRPVPPEAADALLRVTQESLVNAAKHAPGADIAVTLDYPEDVVRLTVTNPLTRDAASVVDGGVTGVEASGGTGAMRTLDGGYGITGMRERVLLLRGTLDAGQRDGQWTVTAELPLPASR
jgi:signal transduction histidine kinase